MRKNLIFDDGEAAFLKELKRRRVQFMIVGLSAAALQGAPVVTQDIDLWFRDLDDPNIRKALKKVGGILVPSIGFNPPMLAGEAVKLFDIVVHMHGLGSFDEELHGAETVELAGVTIDVLPLSRIIKSKFELGREKDLIAMKVLKDALIVKQALSRRQSQGNAGKSRARGTRPGRLRQ